MPIDYSKWKNIEISDDEDDTHPNIDTPSLFRWRHQARIQRMEEFNKEKDDYNKAFEENTNKISELQSKIKEFKNKDADDQKATLEKIVTELTYFEAEKAKLIEAGQELAKKEKLAPWNVDTISKDGFTKTIINKPMTKDNNDHLSEDEKAKLQTQFNKKYSKELKKLGMFSKWDDTKNFLLEHPELVCEETANFFVIWCIDLEVEEKHKLMAHVARQTITMQYLLELAKQLDINPRSVVGSFFTKIKNADKEYMDAFIDEVESFKVRVRDRARIRIEKAMKQIEEEERENRLGPGGLDPIEVIEQLPQPMKDCFEKQDIQMLKDYIVTLESDEAQRLMKLCIDSGLWVPEANTSNDEGGTKPSISSQQENTEENPKIITTS